MTAFYANVVLADKQMTHRRERRRNVTRGERSLAPTIFSQLVT